MNNLDNIKSVISWSSVKNVNGTFTSTVYSFEYEEQTVNHISYVRKTRVQAVGAAKKSMLALKNIKKRQLLAA